MHPFNSSSRRRSRATMNVSILSLLMCTSVSLGFLQSSVSTSPYVNYPTTATEERAVFSSHRSQPSTTALNVWWFGGTGQGEVSNDGSCELVAVRIERLSANSRRIAGEITVPASLDDVWSILTDYDRLSVHVPNLKDSKVVQKNSGGEAGDGQYKCRLYQVGAQKIVGFDFSASVTMDMTEKVLNDNQRMIGFKCVDSQFFKEFDGQWKVQEQIGPDGQVETVCSYVVDVRPKGPVPVAALEWRIREDVPTNLRAVKAASAGSSRPNGVLTKSIRKLSLQAANGIQARRAKFAPQLVPAMMDWDRDETMAKYL